MLLKVEQRLRDMDPGRTLLSVQTFSSLKKDGLPQLEAQLSHWLNADFREPEASEAL
jgi:GTP-binding protein